MSAKKIKPDMRGHADADRLAEANRLVKDGDYVTIADVVFIPANGVTAVRYLAFAPYDEPRATLLLRVMVADFAHRFGAERAIDVATGAAIGRATDDP